MSSQSLGIGHESAHDVERCVGQYPVAGETLETLQDLMSAIEGMRAPNIGMLRSTANRFAEFINKCADEISIETLGLEKANFRRFMLSRKYQANSVRSYCNYLNILLKTASELGWYCATPEFPACWTPITDPLVGKVNRDIIRFAVKTGKVPATFAEEDLSSWRERMVQEGASSENVIHSSYLFRKALVDAGVDAQLPLVKRPKKSYAAPFETLHPILQREIQELLDWKQNDFEPGRPKSAKLRTVSAENLKGTLCRLIGYGQNVEQLKPFEALSEVITRDLVWRFVKWMINARKVKGRSLAPHLGMVYAALHHNERYKGLDLAWFEDLSKSLPMEAESHVARRKATKYISYSEADLLPGKLHALRSKAATKGSRALALNVRNELLMLWLTVLPWRQRNLRECRISGKHPNLFRGKIPPMSAVTKASWILEAEELTPGSSFWQFRFSPDETKMKNEVHAFLPTDLVNLLEEYLCVHRNVLLQGKDDPGMLFLNEKGKAITSPQLRQLVGKLTSRYCGVRVTPHIFRDIVAYEWLTTHPEDYLTVSKLLWHRNVTTTLKIYGQRFDESSGVARMDDWRRHRRQNTA